MILLKTHTHDNLSLLPSLNTPCSSDIVIIWIVIF